MRDYLPYIVLAVILAVVYFIKNKGVIKFPGSGGSTSADLFTAAQALARHEAQVILDSKLADEARKAAIAMHLAPFSGPAAPSDGPPPA